MVSPSRAKRLPIKRYRLHCPIRSSLPSRRMAEDDHSGPPPHTHPPTPPRRQLFWMRRPFPGDFPGNPGARETTGNLAAHPENPPGNATDAHPSSRGMRRGVPGGRISRGLSRAISKSPGDFPGAGIPGKSTGGLPAEFVSREMLGGLPGTWMRAQGISRGFSWAISQVRGKFHAQYLPGNFPGTWTPRPTTREIPVKFPGESDSAASPPGEFSGKFGRGSRIALFSAILPSRALSPDHTPAGSFSPEYAIIRIDC